MTGLIIATAVVSAILLAPHWVFPWATLLLIVLASFEFVALLKKKISTLPPSTLPPSSFLLPPSIFACLGVALIGGGLWAIPYIAGHWGNVMLLYILAIIKFSDTGGFAFGLTSAKLMKGGNHKLCPTISPNKSWEGLLGSVVFSCGVSAAFIPWTHFCVVKALLFGVIAALVGTFGDLVESKFKRWVGVKDSSTMKITNGMGGFLDMFDSLLFAPAVLAWLI